MRDKSTFHLIIYEIILPLELITSIKFELRGITLSNVKIMNNDELKVLFDQQAAGYDKQWTKTASINNALYFLLESVFAELPSDARVLCVALERGKS